MLRRTLWLLVAGLFACNAGVSPATPGSSTPSFPDPRTLDWVSVYSVGDAMLSNIGDEEAIRQQAAIDFRCPLADVRSVPPSIGVAGGRAEGCGHRGVFVAVGAQGASRRAPLHKGNAVTVQLVRFILVAHDTTAAVARLKSHARELDLSMWGPGDGERYIYAGDLGAWADLLDASTRDLACSPDALTLDVVKYSRGPSTFTAEGCGWRAQFVRGGSGTLAMTSKVPVP
jgi:hypothetical protein